MAETVVFEHVSMPLLPAIESTSSPSLQFGLEPLDERIDVRISHEQLSTASVRFVPCGYRAPKIAEDPED